MVDALARLEETEVVFLPVFVARAVVMVLRVVGLGHVVEGAESEGVDSLSDLGGDGGEERTAGLGAELLQRSAGLGDGPTGWAALVLRRGMMLREGDGRAVAN